MKYRLWLLFTFFIGNIYSQDRIVRTDGMEFNCRIDSIDSTNIYFNYVEKEAIINNYIKIENVSTYRINDYTIFIQNTKKPISTTKIGLEGTILLKLPESKNQAQSQSPDYNDKYFAYLFSDEIIYGSLVEFDESNLNFGIRNIYVDFKKIPASEVAFYKNRTGLYANVNKLTLLHYNKFSECIIHGKINLYQSISSGFMPKINSSIQSFPPSYSYFNYKVIRNYYNKDLGELKRANYRDLSVEMSNNPESMIFLKKYKNKKTAEIILLVGGTAAFIGAMKSISAPQVILFCGSFTCFVLVTIFRSKNRNLYK